MERFSRTELLLGSDAVNSLSDRHVAVFGVGGVGGYAVEALARSGVGRFTLVDSDIVSESNINRQIIALNSTVGRYKVDVMKERIMDINPSAEVEVKKCFFLPENADEFDFSKYDYVVDAVDTVAAKIAIITKAKKENVNLISCMGAGNKLDPTAFKVDDIKNTSVCPLAKVMRHELKNRGIDSVKVVYSAEPPVKPAKETDKTQSRRKDIPGSVAFVPSVAGLVLASAVIKDLCGLQK